MTPTRKEAMPFLVRLARRAHPEWFDSFHARAWWGGFYAAQTRFHWACDRIEELEKKLRKARKA